jgi:ribonuclease HI
VLASTLGPTTQGESAPAQTAVPANMASRNVSEALRGSKQTNQRAELTAVARALDHVPIDRDVLIFTDSYYSIRCLTEWSPKWMRNQWKNSAGKDVENRDLVEPIVSRICEREACKAKTKFQWIKGHANDPGNVAADHLAVKGSRLSTPELRGAVEFSVTLRSPIKTKEEWATEKKNEKDDQEYDDIFSSLPAEQLAANSTPVAESDLAVEQLQNETASRC